MRAFVVNMDVFFECDEGDDPQATLDYIVNAIYEAGAGDVKPQAIEDDA